MFSFYLYNKTIDLKEKTFFLQVSARRRQTLTSSWASTRFQLWRHRERGSWPSRLTWSWTKMVTTRSGWPSTPTSACQGTLITGWTSTSWFWFLFLSSCRISIIESSKKNRNNNWSPEYRLNFLMSWFWVFSCYKNWMVIVKIITTKCPTCLYLAPNHGIQ